jgi:hypothetical protein
MRAAAGRRRGAGLRSAGRSVALRPNPQDPTACLGFRALHVEVPLLQCRKY